MKKMFIALLAAMLALHMQAQPGNGPEYSFKGMLNGKIAVEIAFDTDGQELAAGYIYYPKANNPAPILIVGYPQWDDPYNDVFFREFQPDGTVSGSFHLRFTEVEGDYEFVEGFWTNPRTNAELSMKPMRSTFGTPAWWTTSALTPDTPDNIAREYSYSFWNETCKSMMGGNVVFRAAGKNKVHFHVTNCPNNIAEGGSEPGRPAVLNGNRFEYREVNECHYGFKATFFQRFVKLESFEGEYATLECFGMGVAFDGVYVKTKQ